MSLQPQRAYTPITSVGCGGVFSYNSLTHLLRKKGLLVNSTPLTDHWNFRSNFTFTGAQ